ECDRKEKHPHYIKRLLHAEFFHFAKLGMGEICNSDSDGQIEEKVQPPVDQCQKAAKDWADNKSGCHYNGKDSHGPPEFMTGKCIDNEERAVRNNNCAADSLEDAEYNELGDI